MKIIKFYILAFSYSWGIWILGIFFLQGSIGPNLLVSIGGLGPIVSLAVYLKFLTSKKERCEYFNRLLRIKNSPIYCWVLVVFIPILIIIFSTIVDRIFISKEIDVFKMLVLDKEFMQTGWISVIFLLFFGPIPEEMAWRGLAFNELLHKGYLKAQLIVGILWALWHVPLFFIEGSYQFQLGLFTLDFWMFFINVIFISFITGWIYIKSNKSIVTAIIFHYLINLTGEMFYLSTQGQLFKTVMTCVLGLILVLVGRRVERRHYVFK